MSDPGEGPVGHVSSHCVKAAFLHTKTHARDASLTVTWQHPVSSRMNVMLLPQDGTIVEADVYIWKEELRCEAVLRLQ